MRTRYLGHVTGYQPIKDPYFPIRLVPEMIIFQDTAWVTAQSNTFSRWINAQLRSRGHEEIVTDLQRDLKDGTVLAKVLNGLTGNH